MLETATRYTDVRRAAKRRRFRTSGIIGAHRHQGSAPALFVPTLQGQKDSISEWFWREMKEGGWLHNYFQREKAQNPAMIRRVARFMCGFKQNNQSSFKRVATVPAKLYHRWKQEDEHFFECDNNLRSLRRDNPDLPIYVDGPPLPRNRFHKVYPTQLSTLNSQLS